MTVYGTHDGTGLARLCEAVEHSELRSLSFRENCIQIEGAAIVERMLSGGARSLTSIDLRRNYIHSNQVKYHATMQAIVASTVPCALGVKLAFLSGQLRWDTGGAAEQLVAVAICFLCLCLGAGRTCRAFVYRMYGRCLRNAPSFIKHLL